MNLLSETLGELQTNNKSPKDVLWCGNTELYFDWGHFEKIANIEYYNSYGGVEIVMDLIIVGDNWWLERAQYDGSEWWEYKELPIKPSIENKVKSIERGDDYATLTELKS